MTYLAEENEKTLSLSLYIQPRSSKNRISGLHGEALKLCITTPPVDGKANKAVVAFLAKLFGLPKTSITLKSGEKSRSKVITISGTTLAEAEKILAPFL